MFTADRKSSRVEQRESEKPVKILFCIDKLVRGGTELQLIGLINRLDRTRYQPFLLTLRPTDSELIPDRCTHLAWQVPRLSSPAGLRALCKLRNWLLDENVAIVQTYFQDSTLFGSLAARWARVPVRIACFRDMAFWSTRLQVLMMRLACSQMTGYIANSEVVLNHFSNIIGIDPSKSKVIGNGVDAGRLPYIRHEGGARDIGIVGNMTREVKRTDLFIKAAGLVAQNHPGLQWHVIGDGHLRPALEELANEVGIGKNVHFTGRLNDVAGYLKKLDIGVICSDSEGLSNALIEYMFRGVATVATRVGGNPELIEDQVTGLLVPPGDEHALAAAIDRLVRSTELRLEITDKARDKVKTAYSWSTCISSHEAFYSEQLLSKNEANNALC